MRPAELRPPFELIGRISDFSGVLRVTSAKSGTMRPRELGVTGFRLRSAILLSLLPYLIAKRLGDGTSKDVDAIARCDLNDCSLAVAALSLSKPVDFGLTFAVMGVDL